MVVAAAAAAASARAGRASDFYCLTYSHFRANVFKRRKTMCISLLFNVAMKGVSVSFLTSKKDTGVGRTKGRENPEQGRGYYFLKHFSFLAKGGHTEGRQGGKRQSLVQTELCRKALSLVSLPARRAALPGAWPCRLAGPPYAVLSQVKETDIRQEQESVKYFYH